MNEHDVHDVGVVDVAQVHSAGRGQEAGRPAHAPGRLEDDRVGRELDRRPWPAGVAVGRRVGAPQAEHHSLGESPAPHSGHLVRERNLRPGHLIG